MARKGEPAGKCKTCGKEIRWSETAREWYHVRVPKEPHQAVFR